MIIYRKLCLTCLAIACCIHISGFRGCCTCNKMLFEGSDSDKKKPVFKKNFFIKPLSNIKIPEGWEIDSEDQEYYRLKTTQQITDLHAQVKNIKNDESTIALFITTNESNAWNRSSDSYLLFFGEDKIPAVLLVNNPDEKKIRSNYNYNGKPLLVFFYGNAINMYYYFSDEFFHELTQYYNILIPQLPGYASNQRGDFSEKTRNKQINEICKWCQQNYTDNFVVMGFSIGCHFAILLAAKAKNQCKHLFLLNPFLTVRTAAKYVVSKIFGHTLGNILVESILIMQLDNGEAIKKVKSGIDIYYACKDEFVDPKDAEELYKIAKAENKDREVKILPHLELIKREPICVFGEIVGFFKYKVDDNEIEKMGNVPPSSSQGIEKIKDIVGDDFLKYKHNKFPGQKFFLWTRLEKIAAQLTQP